MTLHVPLKMFLSFETALATRLLALELHLLNDRWKVLQGHILTRGLLPDHLP
jgi:hypothetical protein